MFKKEGAISYILLLSLISLFCFSLPAIACAEETTVKLDPAAVGKKAVPIDVIVGKETILKINKPVQEIKQVSLANNEIADIKPLLAFPAAKMVEVVIYGKKPGITSLIVWDKEGNKSFFDVIVHRERMVEFERERADAIESKIKALDPDSNVRVEMAGDTIVLSGTAKNRHMIDRIEKLALLYGSEGCEGISRAESLHPIHLQQKEAAGEPAGYVSVNVAQQAMQQQAEEKETEALCILNLITMPEAQQVILEVKVAQIDKTKLKQLGISYIIKTDDFLLTGPGLFTNVTGTVGEDLAGGNVLPGSGFEGFDLDNSAPNFIFRSYPGDVAALLKALQEKGFGKILAEPNLIVRSGEKGTFHVGRRIPIQTVYGIGASATPSITFEEVGIRLIFAPEVLETGVIRLKIDPAEVSNVIRYLNIGGAIAPEIDTRKVTTSVDLKEGESFIVAGLLSEEMKKNIQKIPILGDIPILGAFFRSTSDELAEKDLAFFITPRMVKPIAPGVKTPLPTDNMPTPEIEREFQWIPMPGSGEGADTTTETK